VSTIVVVRKNGAVALAADTLWKDGATMQRASRLVNHSKILSVGDSFVAFTGSGAWAHVLGQYFARLKRPPQLGSVSEIYETVLRMKSVLEDRYGVNPNDRDNDDFETSRFCLLVANGRGAFGVYPDRSVSEFSTFYAFGSGYRVALGAMHVAYDSALSARDVARAGIEAAAEFDEDTGLPIEVVQVELVPGGPPADPPIKAARSRNGKSRPRASVLRP
jgi:ATP-dependent protease HslVU (ClpYQ) peptidase subunit